FGYYNTGWFEKFVDLALRCVQETSIERPTMSEVVKEIENMMPLAGVNPNSESAPTSSSYEESSAGNIRRISGDDSRFLTAAVTPMHPQRFYVYGHNEGKEVVFPARQAEVRPCLGFANKKEKVDEGKRTVEKLTKMEQMVEEVGEEEFQSIRFEGFKCDHQRIRRPSQQGKSYTVEEMRAAMNKSKDLHSLRGLIDPIIGSDALMLVGFEEFVNLAMKFVEDIPAVRPTMGKVAKGIEHIM
ncbi:hypothetical protein Ancab_003281, partial [Ancistrocladus abbreviatus]